MAKPSIEFYNAAVDAVQSGDLPLALKSVEVSLTESPDDAQTWQLYAVILNALGQTEKAEKALVKVKEFGLSKIDELLMKAADAAGQGKMGIAITHYEDALEIDQTRAEIYTSYALALMEEKYADDALEAASKAVELAPDDPFAQYTKGRILRLSGKNEESLEALTAATELDPNLVLAAYERGMILAEIGRLDKALQCFEKVLIDHPEDSNAADAKAFILQKIEEGQQNG
ncbi:tetratricopeptide repeat protein [Akkermansiaceae bacterium]|jgi:tetratricopeptide (TPR) repeat protein|nr:tetratricopeptide repeat protein [Akkermansiaceae bacterium]MDB4400687.1 tetratricopeptide repeat protein [Akkermansiaceae bacterium]MDB4519934.1 tetratricopeptide repeat protein [Akkermansiaceae bacterium]|tara:strand:- start:1826 stop:2515 length:690 start_codon:yes stop_codon:yes gene_type:complete